MENIQTLSTEEEYFSIQDMEFGVNYPQKGNLRKLKATKKKY